MATPKIGISVQLTVGLHELLVREATRRGVPVAEVVREALAVALEAPVYLEPAAPRLAAPPLGA